LAEEWLQTAGFAPKLRNVAKNTTSHYEFHDQDFALTTVQWLLL
jgi:hypothetical protein